MPSRVEASSVSSREPSSCPLLPKWLHHLFRAGLVWSSSTLASMPRLNLFTYRPLMEWLDEPFGTPPVIPVPEELRLPIAESDRTTPPLPGTFQARSWGDLYPSAVRHGSWR